MCPGSPPRCCQRCCQAGRSGILRVVIHWTKDPRPGLHFGTAEPSERQYMVMLIPAGWLPHVWRRFERPMSNDPRDPTPPSSEAEVEGWYSLAVGVSPTVDEAMAS